MEDENKVSEIVGKLSGTMSEARKSGEFVRLVLEKDADGNITDNIVAMYFKKKPKLDPEVKAQRAAERKMKSQKKSLTNEIKELGVKMATTKKKLATAKKELEELEASSQSVKVIKDATDTKRGMVKRLSDRLEGYNARLPEAKAELAKLG